MNYQLQSKSDDQTGYYILIASDGYTLASPSTLVSAWSLAERRLEAGAWALYENTSNRHALKPGDRVLIYLAGSMKAAQHFVAMSTIEGIHSPSKQALKEMDEDILGTKVHSILKLKDTTWLEPIGIRSKREKLSFLPKHSRWGAALMGGCRRILRDDFDAIVN